MKEKEWAMIVIVVIVIVVIVVAIVASLITANITGNVIKVSPLKKGGTQVYTKAEVDNLMSGLSQQEGSCRYIGYNDNLPSGEKARNMYFRTACEKEFGYVPRVIVLQRENSLYNRPDCNPSYRIHRVVSENLISYNESGPDERLGEMAPSYCNNAYISGSKPLTINENFSNGVQTLTSGVLCCSN